LEEKCETQIKQNKSSAALAPFSGTAKMATQFEFEYHHSVAEGLTALAAAVRDIYDKLEQIQRDLHSNSIRIS